MSSFVGISTPSTSLVEDFLADAISVARGRPLGQPSELSDEDVDASGVGTNVDRLTT